MHGCIYLIDGVEEADPGLRDDSALTVAISNETLKAEALVSSNVSVASITAKIEAEAEAEKSQNKSLSSQEVAAQGKVHTNLYKKM